MAADQPASSPGKGRNPSLNTLLMASLPLVFLWSLPVLIQLLGSSLGWTLRKKTDGRRAHLKALMNEDDKKYRLRNAGRESNLGEEWRNIKALAEQKDTQKDWDGIIGFFHPFWYVAS